MKDPSQAPGRLTSSPWPDRIEITRFERLGEGEQAAASGEAPVYAVYGRILWMTSVEVVQGGHAGEQPVRLEVVQSEDRGWRIAGLSTEPGGFNPN